MSSNFKNFWDNYDEEIIEAMDEYEIKNSQRKLIINTIEEEFNNLLETFNNDYNQIKEIIIEIILKKQINEKTNEYNQFTKNDIKNIIYTKINKKIAEERMINEEDMDKDDYVTNNYNGYLDKEHNPDQFLPNNYEENPNIEIEKPLSYNKPKRKIFKKNHKK